MKFIELQKDMRVSYLGGGTGILISGMVWSVSGILGLYSTKEISILTFFFGGMLIYPLGILSTRLFKRTGRHQKNNPFAYLAYESTAILFIGLFLAYSIFQVVEEWFYPVMLMFIGARYLVFQTIYGIKIFWIMGLLLTLAGMLCLIFNQPFHSGAIIGGIIEISIGIIIIVMEFKPSKAHR